MALWGIIVGSWKQTNKCSELKISLFIIIQYAALSFSSCTCRETKTNTHRQRNTWIRWHTLLRFCHSRKISLSNLRKPQAAKKSPYCVISRWQTVHIMTQELLFSFQFNVVFSHKLKNNNNFKPVFRLKICQNCLLSGDEKVQSYNLIS